MKTPLSDTTLKRRTPETKRARQTLLLVDDNRDILTFLKTLIENEGWKVYYAECTGQAKTLFAERHVDVAILDQHLPDGTGLQLALDFRIEDPDLPICIMSGDTLPEAEYLLAKDNHFFVLQKPFLVPQLLRTLQNAIKSLGQFTPVGKIEVFFSYSHKDERVRNELERHLTALKRDGIIRGWHDRKIVPGRDIDQEIDIALERADLILLLVSADFIASDYCYSKELARAMDRHNNGRARVIPIIVRPVDWATCVFGRLMALPRDGKPIISWSKRDAALLDVARGIRRAAEELSVMPQRDES